MKERCGVVINNNFYEIKNISDNPEIEFVMDPVELYEILKKEGSEIQYIIHTHDNTCIPSLKDLEGMRVWRVPWIILSRECIKGYYYSVFGILELDIISLLSKEVYNSIMKLLE